MERPTDAPRVNQISFSSEKAPSMAIPDLNYNSYTFENEAMEKFSIQDDLPAHIFSRLQSTLRMDSIPQAIRDIIMSADNILEPTGLQSTTALLYEDPFEVAQKYLEKHNIMQIFQIQQLIKERDEKK